MQAMRHHHSDPADEDDFPEPPSKSSRKREMQALQDLGEQLVALSPERLKKVPLPETLYEAIRAAQGFKMEARRRQLQYIGKLMRKIDAEPVRQAVADFKLGRAQDSLTLHESEAWRERLLAQDEALQDFIGQHPGVDVQQLRSLVRAARKDASVAPEQRSGRAFRELFQFIKAEAKRVAQEASAEGLDGDGDGDE